jgi:hypothetical protein
MPDRNPLIEKDELTFEEMASLKPGEMGAHLAHLVQKQIDLEQAESPSEAVQ